MTQPDTNATPDRFDTLAREWDVAPMHLDRTRDVATSMRESLPLEGLSALEVGAGTGLLSFALCEPLASVVASDPSAGMIQALEAKIQTSGVGNIRAVRCGDDLAGVDGPFQLVMSQMALHHIPDVPGFLARAFERLAPGGWIAIADLDTEDGSFHGPAVTDVHFGFDRGELESWLGTAGFAEIRFGTVHVMRRGTDAATREYPIFLVIGRRP